MSSSMLFRHAELYTGEMGGVVSDGALRVEEGTITHVGSTTESASWAAGQAHSYFGGAPPGPGELAKPHHPRGWGSRLR